MSAEGESRQRRSEAMLLQKNLKSWSAISSVLRGQFLTKMFTTLIVIYMFIFIHNAFHTSTPTNFIFCWVYKVFCISVSVISKLVYSVILCPCIIIIRIHSKKSKQMSKSGFFLSWSHVGLNSGFSSKTGRIPAKSEWLDSLYCQRRCQLLEI